jgi:hypothetical protein
MAIKGCLLVWLLTAISSAQGSPILIDPGMGWSGYFHWTNGPGPLDGIQDKRVPARHLRASFESVYNRARGLGVVEFLLVHGGPLTFMISTEVGIARL